jgi:hypothetical protein
MVVQTFTFLSPLYDILEPDRFLGRHSKVLSALDADLADIAGAFGFLPSPGFFL